MLEQVNGVLTTYSATGPASGSPHQIAVKRILASLGPVRSTYVSSRLDLPSQRTAYYGTVQREVLAATRTCHRPCLFYS